MKLIYRCQNCGAQNEADTNESSWFKVLNIAYTPNMDIERGATGIKPYTTHPCEPDVIGIAQLVGIKGYV